ncbi:hypothetical protein J7400_12070 [Shimia sp. R9_2]|uniref:hypothetical protein n=1 Tax=Shimia sp. R9_2 TaxID=2821112 RepID=UPI001ADD1B38|nr:hypothetical protein [Shimia sp. R9_2]MBO9397417.1 hypothetical protein [Shimia sp. R9_2]
MSDLHQRLLAAHAGEDAAALVALYQEAANAAPDMDAQGFYLTQAYVYALESGHAATEGLRTQLQALGREQGQVD